MDAIDGAGRPDASRGMRGLDRRTMIKHAAIAGATAWTAPVIIDSLTSPAAAVSTCGAAGTYRIQILRSGTLCSLSTPTPTLNPDCTVDNLDHTAWISATNAGTTITDNLSFIGSGCISTNTITLNCGNCVFTDASRAVRGVISGADACYTPTIGGTAGVNSTISFPAAGGVQVFALFVTCS